MKLGALAFTLSAVAVLLFLPDAAQAQRFPYGAPITLEQAKKVAAAGQAEQKKINVPTGVAIAVLDSGCRLVLLETMDNSNVGVPPIAQDKAYTACAFRVNTKNSQDFMAKGGAGMILLKLRDFTPIEGGEPIIVDGKTIGAVGVSGGSSEQDALIAKAAAAAISK
jgi:glc operon protein GlcG